MKNPFPAYIVTITVEGVDSDGKPSGVELKVKIPDVPRDVILKPSYGGGGITQLVKTLEKSLE